MWWFPKNNISVAVNLISNSRSFVFCPKLDSMIKLNIELQIMAVEPATDSNYLVLFEIDSSCSCSLSFVLPCSWFLLLPDILVDSISGSRRMYLGSWTRSQAHWSANAPSPDSCHAQGIPFSSVWCQQTYRTEPIIGSLSKSSNSSQDAIGMHLLLFPCHVVYFLIKLMKDSAVGVTFW